MINAQIRQFREKVISTINSESLPIEIKRLVIMEINQQLNEVADKAIQNELSQAAEASMEEGGAVE